MDPREVRFLIDMNLAAGRRYRLVEQVGISPLRFNDRAIEVALTFAADPDVDVALDGFIPMAGATCPLDPRSAVVQAVAEALAHDFLCTTLGIAGGTLAARIEPFDFQYTTIVFGSPEWCLYRAAVVRMNEHVTGRRPSGGRFRTVAKQPDEQAACERTASVLWQALAGARHFGAVGQLSVDEVFSPQQAAIDREILGYVERVIDGLEIQAEAGDALQLIDEGVRSGHFVGIADTVDRFRAFYRFPDLFRHWSCGKWRAEGSPSILGEAWAIAQREIASSDSMLPEVALAAIAKVYMRAEEYVRRTSTGR
jgi:trimethylamine:corrinoid methyltransferase-like protein